MAHTVKVSGHISPCQSLLSPRGRFYLVAVKQNDIQGICSRMLSQHGLKGEVCPIHPYIPSPLTLPQIALQRRAGLEHLYVLRFTRQDSET